MVAQLSDRLSKLTSLATWSISQRVYETLKCLGHFRRRADVFVKCSTNVVLCISRNVHSSAVRDDVFGTPGCLCIGSVTSSKELKVALLCIVEDLAV